MSNKTIKLAKNEILFREGEQSESMYLIKSGRMAVFRSNAAKDGEIVLSEKIQGELLGEMAFFDNQSRSAGAKAMVPSELVELPFKVLQEQLQESPPWLKVMVKTISTQLRKANVRIRNLENIVGDSYEKISSQTLLHVVAVIHLLGGAAPKNAQGQPSFSYKELHTYVRQVFGQSSKKLNRITAILQELGFLSVEGAPESQQQTVVIKAHSVLGEFVNWYSEHLAASDSDRVVLEPEDYSTLRVLAHYGKNVAPEKDGQVKLSVDLMEKSAPKDVNVNFRGKDVDTLARKGIVKARSLHENGSFTSFSASEIQRLERFWGIIQAASKPLA